MNKLRQLMTSGSFFAAFMLVASQTAAGGVSSGTPFSDQIGWLDVSGTLVWAEAPIEFEQAVLHVSKRGTDEIWTAEFGRGSILSLDLADLIEGAPVDGRYNFELELTVPGSIRLQEDSFRLATMGRFDVKEGSIENVLLPGAEQPAARDESGTEATIQQSDEFVDGDLRVSGWGCYGCESDRSITDGKVEIIAPEEGSAAATLYTVEVDETASLWTVGNQAGDFAFVDGKNAVVAFEGGAPVASFHIDSSGAIGMGTSGPQSALHVRRTDGTAGILLEETEAIATNTMFEMSHNGNPGFGLENTDSGVQWQFRLGGSGPTEQFTVNKLGTGDPEMSVLHNGDMNLRGTLNEGSSRSVKQDLLDVEHEEILERVLELPILQWSYQDSPGVRHIGPMAEEFHEIFGFGGSSKMIAPRDLAGLALAASQALQNKNAELKASNMELEARIDRLETQLNQLLEREQSVTAH